MIYSLNQLSKMGFIGLKSRKSILKYISEGKLKATDISPKGCKYKKLVVSDNNLKEFYEQRKSI